MSIHKIEIDVTFGDCDPAGIVFYPNTYRWMDKCFHDWLRRFGGHAGLMKSVNGLGVGLRNAGADFHRPMRDGDRVEVLIQGLDWQDRALTLHYEGRSAGGVVFTGEETRALFVVTAAGMKAGQMDDLRAAIGAYGQGN